MNASGIVQSLAAKSEQRVTTNGIAYRYFGRGHAVILLHGSSGSWTHWTRNIDCLSKDRTVFALDLPGFGASAGIAPDISVEAYIHMVAEAIAEMCSGDAPLDIVGFSFGGAVAAGAAAQLHERLRRLSLLTPSGFDRPTGRTVTRPRRKDFASSDEGRRAFHREMLRVIMFADERSIDEEAIDIQAKNAARSRFDGSHISWSGRLPDCLRQIERPIQMIYGERDPMPFPSAQERVAACRAVRPSIRVDWVEGAGHWVQYERAQKVNELLTDFLGGTLEDDLVKGEPHHVV